MDPEHEPSIDVSREEAPTQSSERESQTAQDFIASQLQLEADAREALPYFDTCTRPLGALRQILFSCLTCSPPPNDPSHPYTPAGVCYSCSISCHGEHELVELFGRRDFVCDCGTKRLLSTSPCALRTNPETGVKGGVHSQEPAANNKYNQNFANRFCGCGELYDPIKEKGTMFQCLGLGDVEDGGCGEDWWHPECVVGLGRDWHKKRMREADEEGKNNDENASARAHQQLEACNLEVNGSTNLHGSDGIQQDEDPPLPPGFPAEDDFEHMICYKCVNAFPWIRRYAKMPGFVATTWRRGPLIANRASDSSAEWIKEQESEGDVLPRTGDTLETIATKRKAEELVEDAQVEPAFKKMKSQDGIPSTDSEAPQATPCRYSALLPASEEDVSLFLPSDFRDRLCRCSNCFPKLAKHLQLLDEEESYSPPISESSSAAANGEESQSVGSRSLLDRGEAALSNIDRVRAIEGVMAYNHLRDKVKDFLKPFAASGQAVGAEDVKQYFEKLRGDEAAIRAAGGKQSDGDGDEGDNRREQSGY